MAGVVADFGAFDLDDVGAEIGKRLRAPRPGEHAGEIQHADMTESAHVVRCLLCSQSGARAPRDGGNLKRFPRAGAVSRTS